MTLSQLDLLEVFLAAKMGEFPSPVFSRERLIASPCLDRSLKLLRDIMFCVVRLRFEAAILEVKRKQIMIMLREIIC